MEHVTSPGLVVLEPEALYRRAAELFAQTAIESVDSRGVFTVALSGGSTPKPLYSLLSTEFSNALPLTNTQVFFADERCVPPDHPDSNFGSIDELLLAKSGISRLNVHRMKGEIDPLAAADEYENELREAFALRPGDFPQFDLILLGLGEDCHTASLFPDSEALDETARLVTAPYVTRLKTHRITLTPPVLKNARRVIFLVVGKAKAEAVQRAIGGEYQPKLCPAQVLRRAAGEVMWILDPDAAAKLARR
jgi:6-phosphogluconolactonase